MLARVDGTVCDFLQCWLLSQDWEAINTSPGILNKFLLLKQKSRLLVSELGYRRHACARSHNTVGSALVFTSRGRKALARAFAE